MTATQTSKMIGDGVQVILSGMPKRFLIQFTEFLQIQTLKWKVNSFTYFLSLTNLCIHHATNPTPSLCIFIFPSYKPFKLNTQNLWCPIDLQLFGNISVFLTFIAVPLIVSTDVFFLAVFSEAGIQIDHAG
jgi:hypothetical protein